jgi:predicted nucleic acid-binding protein
VIAYVDSSILLRVILRQPTALAELPAIERGIASALVEVECLRTLDRHRLLEGISDADIAGLRGAVFRLLESVETIELTPEILGRAALPLPTSLGTLDAIHLATAALWREQMGTNLVMATHDLSLATAARALGMSVIGV